MERGLKIRVDTPLLQMSSWQWKASDIDREIECPGALSLENQPTGTTPTVELQIVVPPLGFSPPSPPKPSSNSPASPLRNSETHATDLQARKKAGLQNIKSLLKTKREQKAAREREEALSKAVLIRPPKSKNGPGCEPESLAMLTQPSQVKQMTNTAGSIRKVTCETPNLEESMIPREENRSNKTPKKVVRKSKKRAILYSVQDRPSSSVRGSPRRGVAVPKIQDISQSAIDHSHLIHNHPFSDHLPAGRIRSRAELLSSTKNKPRVKRLRTHHHFAETAEIASSSSNPNSLKSSQLSPFLHTRAQETQGSIDTPDVLPKDLLELIPFLRHFDRLHHKALNAKDEEIATLKAELATLVNTEADCEAILSSETMTYSKNPAKFGEEHAQPGKDEIVAKDGTEALESNPATTNEVAASINAIPETSSLKVQIIGLTDEVTKQTRLVNKYTSKWKRVKMAYKHQNASWEEEKKYVMKLTEDLKEISDELREEKLQGKRGEYERLKKMVEEMLAMPEIAPMASISFGRVGQAFINLQETLKQTGGNWNSEMGKDGIV